MLFSNKVDGVKQNNNVLFTVCVLVSNSKIMRRVSDIYYDVLSDSTFRKVSVEYLCLFGKSVFQQE